jgi:protein-disulfide isomerase
MRRVAIFLLLLCLGCTGQTISPEAKQRVTEQVRAYFNIPPEVSIEVGTPTASEFPNYDTVPITMSHEGKAQKVEFLLSKDGKTLLRMTRIDLTKDIYADTMGKIDLQGRPVRGNPNAKVTIVNYDDFQCPFCSRMHSTLMTEILPQYGDRIRVIYKDFPLPMHPWAPHAANDANCLAKESSTGYWQLADYLHSNQRAISGNGDLEKSKAELDRLTIDFAKKNGADTTVLQACLKAQPDEALKASMAEGDKLGLNATPTLFINGEKLEGAVDASELRAAIDERLKAAGIQPPAPAPAASAPASPNTSK